VGEVQVAWVHRAVKTGWTGRRHVMHSCAMILRSPRPRLQIAGTRGVGRHGAPRRIGPGARAKISGGALLRKLMVTAALLALKFLVSM